MSSNRERLVEYEKMRPDQIRAAREKCPVAYLPCGILEWHGRHNPVGLDGVKAHLLLIRIAKELGGLVMPPLWYGDHRADVLENVYYPERFKNLTFDHRPKVAEVYGINLADIQADAERSTKNGGWELFKRILIQNFFQFQTFGFKKIFVLTGHYPLYGPANEAAKMFHEMPDSHAKVYAFTEVTLIRDQGFSGDHAARWETSTMLSLCPDLVDLDAIEAEGKELLGVAGQDPRYGAASAELAEGGFVALAEAIRKLINNQ